MVAILSVGTPATCCCGPWAAAKPCAYHWATATWS